MFKDDYCRDMNALTLGEQGKEKILHAMEEEKPVKRTVGRTLLIAAALCALLALTAMAVELTVGWESFLGRTPREAVTAVDVSAVTGDYTLTLQEAIVDDDEAAFLLALTRNDGAALEGDPQLSGNMFSWSVYVDGERPNMGKEEQSPIRSEDGRTVYYCVEFEPQMEAQSLAGKTITFQCKGVVDRVWSEEEIDRVRRETVSLASIAPATKRLDMSCSDARDRENEPELLALVEKLSAQAAVPLTKYGEGNEISAILFGNDAVPMVVVGDSRGSLRQGQYLVGSCTALALTDVRTGERWGCTGYVWRGDDTGFYLCEFDGCPITEEDLPYFEVTVDYEAEKILSDQPVELSFSAGQGHQTVAELDEDATFYYIGKRATVHMTQAHISALRLQLTFDRIKWDGGERSGNGEDTKWTLLEKDGSRIPLTPPAIRTDRETGAGVIRLKGRSEDLDRRLIDPDQVEALLIGDIRIPLK